MLRLNASVHTWLTQQERKRAEIAGKQQQIESVTTALATNAINGGNSDTVHISASMKETSTQSIDASAVIADEEFHKQLKNEVGNMYSVWEVADQRFVSYIHKMYTQNDHILQYLAPGLRRLCKHSTGNLMKSLAPNTETIYICVWLRRWLNKSVCIQIDKWDARNIAGQSMHIYDPSGSAKACDSHRHRPNRTEAINLNFTLWAHTNA